ncbi:hypothetical protein PEX1_040570 [Penicillium expansum]|uniref:Uncharacterized protein n=1 Tax=Penicillium expansum TaxID=27334 RepID=A0A0A2JSX9_PENEN|nr:hypothetical protein PEX2_021760 [Penicillium expansum]KGO47745.1 hypothetical protein PEX1_040570 [Penicillium expansum]KGO49035.1 hypothetical protein PEXP_010840 [Penicillium expansum]KGO57733.1 hypothetical protein PEX2_021760 [Penicillium expansum]
MQESLSETTSSGQLCYESNAKKLGGPTCRRFQSIHLKAPAQKLDLIHALEQLAVSERCQLTNDSDSARERLPGKT